MSVKLFATAAVVAIFFDGTIAAALPTHVGASSGSRSVDLPTVSAAGTRLEVSKHKRHRKKNKIQQPVDAEAPPGVDLLLSNLGSQGPDKAVFPAMVIANVGQLSNGGSMTLVWANNTKYEAATPTSNTLFNGMYPAINVMCDTNVSLRGVFIDNSTGMPLRVKRFFLSFLMLDMNDDKSGIQQVVAYDVPTISISTNTSLEVRTYGNSDMRFTGTTMNKIHGAPMNPWNLTEQEKAGTVTLEWNDVEEISVCLFVYGCPSSGAQGRTFKMAGLTSVVPNMDAKRGANGMQSLKSTF